MNIQENEPLCRHTTLRVGGPARFFVEATSDEQIREALEFGRKRRLPVFVLGGGSNILMSDAGFAGLVIRMASAGMRTREASSTETEVTAEAGEVWDDLVAFAVERGLHGLENMSLIPGTVGAAVIGNIGAYGAEVKDALLWAEALDAQTGTCRRFTANECAFAYRDSFFKSVQGRRFIVTRAAFLLRRDTALNTGYRDVKEFLRARGNRNPSLRDVRDAVIAIRRSKLPDVAQTGTAGSFFKNPVVTRSDHEALKARYPGLPGYPEGEDRVKVPLGWILDKVCGLKGARWGRVGTHAGQALVIVNDGGTATEIEAVASAIARSVKEKTAITIEWEVEKIETPP
jgi:UDP-N-acetylmuramate dehydrogenase